MTKEERAIYNMRQTLKFVAQQYNQILRENIEYLDREDRDRIETTIYNMRQTLKFVAQQYNQIPQMNEEEVEQHEARLEANG